MAQLAHAALQSARLFGLIAEEWIVVCAVPDLAALRAAHERLHRKGVQTTLFFEPTLNDGEFTALASEPVRSTSKRKAFFPYETYGKQLAGVAQC